MTGLIPRPFIDELLHRTDIVELIDGYVPLKKSGRNHTACCPFHNEKTPSFNVSDKKQFYHCFGCGVSGNAISFLMEYAQLNFVESIELLAGKLGMQVPREGGQEIKKQNPSLSKLLEKINDYYRANLKKNDRAIAYLKNRQVSGEIAAQYQLGYAPGSWHELERLYKTERQELIDSGMVIQKDDGSCYDRYRDRISFPIRDRHGRMIGFGGRSIDSDQKPKYLNSPETAIFQKSRELYGLHQVIKDGNKPNQIIVVEGYMDVIALAQHGIPNVVATLGTATSSQHIQLLSKYCSKIIFCFDGDQAGRQAAWRGLESCLPYLNQGLSAYFSFLPEEHDPDSLVREEGKDAFLKRLDKATALNQFFYSTLSKTIDMKSMAGKGQLVNAAKPYLQKMTEGAVKELMLDELARLTRIDSHRLNQMVADKIIDKSMDLDRAISRSPMRIAVALLLQNPELYSLCEANIPRVLFDSQEQSTLSLVLKQIEENQKISTAALIEAWRNESLFETLSQLASWDHQVPDEALQAEFLDTLHFLAEKIRSKQINDLLDKSRSDGLEDHERQLLQTLLKDRHRVNEQRI